MPLDVAALLLLLVFLRMPCHLNLFLFDIDNYETEHKRARKESERKKKVHYDEKVFKSGKFLDAKMFCAVLC